MSSARFGVVVQVSLVDTSALLASRSEAPSFSMLVHRPGDPVVSGVASNGLVLRVYQNDFVVLVGRVLVDPVRIENSQIRSSSANSFLSSGSQRSLVLELVDTHVGGLTVGGSLGYRSLSSSSSDSDSVNDKSLLGLVTKSSSLVGSRRSRSSVNNIQLSVFPASHSVQESKNIRLFVSRDFFQIFVGSHFGGCCRSCQIEVSKVGAKSSTLLGEKIS